MTMTPPNADHRAAGEAVAWVELKRGPFGSAWHTPDGTKDMPEGRYYTDPAGAIAALTADNERLRSELIRVTNPDGSPNLAAEQSGAAESYRAAAIYANEQREAAERTAEELRWMVAGLVVAAKRVIRGRHNHRASDSPDGGESCGLCGHNWRNTDWHFIVGESAATDEANLEAAIARIDAITAKEQS